MSATELAAVVMVVAALIAVGVSIAVIIGLRHTVKDLERAIDAIRARIEPATDELVSTANQLSEEANRAKGVLETIDAISTRSDALSKASYKAIAEPVIRTASVIRGTSKATRRLRGRSDEEKKK